MNALMEYRNDTISLSHINAIISLTSLMANKFLPQSFVLITDVNIIASESEFFKMASNSYIKMNYDNFIKGNYRTKSENLGFIVLGKPGFNFSKVINIKPKVIIAVYKTTENIVQTKLISELVVPPSIPFFIVSVAEENNFFSPYTSHNAIARCFRLYRPIQNITSRVFPIMFYGGADNPKWFWETDKTNWNSFLTETRDMSGINITLAFVVNQMQEKAMERAHSFWKYRSSFFWKSLIEHLHFRCTMHVQSVVSQEVKSISSAYIRLLMTIADGLAVLPVISSERDQFMDFILTGLDSKYHLLVRAPQYIHSWQTVLKPFAFESWMCLGVAILLIIVTFRIVTYYQNLLTDLSGCGIIIFGFLCFQGCPTIPRSLSSRLVCYTALIFSILIYQFYTSNFYSLLSTKEVSLPFNSLEQFVAKKTHTLHVHPDTAIYTFIQKAENGTFKTLREEFLKKDPLHRLTKKNRKKSIARVCKGVGAILGLPFQTFPMEEIKCKLVPVNSGYFPGNVVTVVRKNFPFKSQFKFVHLRLLEAGISHKYRDEQLNPEQLHNVKADVVNERVSLEHVAFLFVFHAVAIIFSWLILGIEIIYSNSFKNKNSKKHLFL